MTVPEAQQHRVLRRYDLRRRRISLRGGTLSLVAPRSMDDLLVGPHLARYERLGRLPYWADVWPASLAIARALARGPELTGRQVLDLGCGVGLAGTAAAWRGAEVTFVDLEPDALAFARFNALHNGASTVRVLRHDFERTPVGGSFDCILIADVTYERRLHGPIRAQLQAGLAPDGMAWIADPFRRQADPLLSELASEFQCRQVQTTVSDGVRRLPLRLVEVRRNPVPVAAQSGPRA